MIYENKHEFMEGLRTALAQNDVKDARDIMIDFEMHFDDGMAAGESEADICRKLGDVDELVKQYISEDDAAAAPAGKAPESPGKAVTDDPSMQASAEKTVYDGASAYGANVTSDKYTYEQPSGSPYNAAPGAGQSYTDSENRPDTGAIIIALCLDVFVYSWALPTLIGLIFGLMGTTLGFVGSGLGIFIAGVISIFADVSGFVSTGLAPVSMIFLGIMLTALGGMLVVASIASVRGFINLCIAIINQHSKAFTGRKILSKLGKKKNAAEKEAAVQ
ncbi:MAG: DUF1700 domain-containing protein [Ruminiclostridium sp.]|nr:DUF1700 domain-containing protein [Ruminiclostridium sp.]